MNHTLHDLFATRVRDVPPPMYGPAPTRGGKLISFSYGLADPDLFPREDLLAATAAVLEQDAAEALNYGATFPGLTEQIVARLRAQGIEAENENVLVSYGSGQILGLLPQVFVDPGDTVLIEGPSFMGAVRHFADAGARLVTVPTDHQGMDVDALEQLLRDLRRQSIRPKFIYSIPTFQNPTGTTMPLARRQQLVALGAEYGVVIVEDDAYGDLRFEGQPVPHLAALDQDGWVIRLGTFSKILAPGIRMGWVHARPEVIQRSRPCQGRGRERPVYDSRGGALLRRWPAGCAHPGADRALPQQARPDARRDRPRVPARGDGAAPRRRLLHLVQAAARHERARPGAAGPGARRGLYAWGALLRRWPGR